MQRLLADLPSRSYEVLVGAGALATLGDELAKRRPGGQAVLCTDANVAPLYLEQARASLAGAGYVVSHIVVPPGESEKSLDRAAELYGVLYDRGVRRGDTLVALGGGVVGDLIGFVASTFLRGVGFVQAPTTLLAQVDASLGGKVAVDFRAGKNYVGTFYQPHLVVTDLTALRTLPQRELRSGAAEVAKYGFLAGGWLLELVEVIGIDREAATLPSDGLDPDPGETSDAPAVLRPEEFTEELIAACASEKLDVVGFDEREETGQRAVLNLGHTVGHAIEAATGFRKYTHGEAVGLGLRAALVLSHRLHGLEEPEMDRGLHVLDILGLPRILEGASPAEVCALTARDKKAGEEGIEFVLLEAFGSPRLRSHVPARLLEEVVTRLAT